MRFLHTSDWHLGRAFHNVGLLEAQTRVLDHLVQTVRNESIDAVLVSGDVYDRALPGPDAVALLSETLERLVDTGAQVVLSSGNHDSAVRLGFASGLLSRAGVHIRTELAELGSPVVIDEVAIYPIPYLEPSVCGPHLEAADRTHAGVLRAAMDRVGADQRTRGLPGVVMAHAFVTGGATCESERDISVGGVSAVHPDTFAGMAYAALGHLHGRQQVAEAVHYSGSPVAMSFSEADHVKGYAVVEVGAGGLVSVEQVPAPVERPLRRLRGRLAELLTEARYGEAESAWCAVVLTDPVRPVAAMEQLRRRFPHTIKLDFDPEGVPATTTTYAARVADRGDLDVCCDFLTHVRGGVVPGPGERALLTEAITGARLERMRRDDEGVAARSQPTLADGEVA